jgi:hypothetical protein
MHFTSRRALAALVMGLCLPVSAFAQDVSFTTLERSNYGGPPQAGQVVARTAAEFQAAGLDQLLPNAQVDWQDEMVIAVYMGARTTGGYSIEVERIRNRPFPPPPAGVPVSPQHEIEVRVRSTSPAPGQIVTQAITMPFHVVKLAQDPMGVVRFRHVGGGSSGTGMGHLSFDTLMQSNRGPAQAQTTVLRSFSELNAFLAPHGAPIGMHVDFATKSVVAVALGYSSFGTTVEITDIERRHAVPTQLPGMPTPMPPYPVETVVRYETTVPTGPVISIVAAPFHLVTVDKIPASDLVVFEDVSPSNPFDLLTRDRRWNMGARTWTLRVDAAGTVEYDRTDPQAKYARLTGQLTPAELQALKTAVQDARIDTLPATLTSPSQSPPFVADTTRYTVQGGAQDGADAGGWTGLFEPQYAARLAPVDAILNAIVDRLLAAPAPTFNSATLSTQHPFGASSQWPMSKDTVVRADGSVEVLKSHPTALFAPISGQATPAELARLSDAIDAASLSSIPSPLPVAVPMHLPSNPFTLAVDSAAPQNAAQVSGQLGYYGQWDARLRPVIEAIEAIGRRVELQTFPPGEVSGEVELAANGSVSLNDGNATWDVNADTDTLRDLRKFEGRTVSVAGQVTFAPGIPGGPMHGAVDVTAITSPVRQTLNAVVYEDQAGDPVLMLGSIFQTAPLQRIEAFGRAARVLERATDREITADAWLFRDANGTATGAYLESIDGEARRFSVLTVRGQWRGFVRRGDAVKVERLSRSGRFARVDGPQGSGYLRVNRLTIGRPLPAIGPQPTAATGPSTGLAGAVSGASGN